MRVEEQLNYPDCSELKDTVYHDVRAKEGWRMCFRLTRNKKAEDLNQVKPQVEKEERNESF